MAEIQTIRVKDADGNERVINASDFNAEVHTEAKAPVEKTKVEDPPAAEESKPATRRARSK